MRRKRAQGASSLVMVNTVFKKKGLKVLILERMYYTYSELITKIPFSSSESKHPEGYSENTTL